MLIRWGNVAAAIGTVRASASAQPAVNLAFEFLVLTAARSGKVRLATWAEMDTAERWTPSAGQLIDVAKWNLLRYIPAPVSRARLAVKVFAIRNSISSLGTLS